MSITGDVTDSDAVSYAHEYTMHAQAQGTVYTNRMRTNLCDKQNN